MNGSRRHAALTAPAFLLVLVLLSLTSACESAGRVSSPDRPDIEWVFSRAAEVAFMKTTATVGMYRGCVEAGVCQDINHRTQSDDKHCNWGYADRVDHPINCVSWHGAAQFCGWVGGRLPTEDEWYAEASDGGQRDYPWGAQPVSCRHAVMADGGWGCGRGSTWPVCSKPAGNSVSGLCDMSGSVWEWTASEDDAQRVLRGGTWFLNKSEMLRSSARFVMQPGLKYHSTGFRCVRPAGSTGP